MPYTSANIGVFANIPMECRAICYTELTLTEMQFNLLRPVRLPARQLLSPISALMRTSKDFCEEIVGWFKLHQTMRLGLRDDKTLGLGIHLPSRVTYIANYMDCFTDAAKSDNELMLPIMRQIEAFRDIPNLPVVTNITLHPGFGHRWVIHESIHRFALLQHILSHFTDIAHIKVMFSPKSSDETRALFNTLKWWNLLATLAIDDKNARRLTPIELTFWVDRQENLCADVERFLSPTGEVDRKRLYAHLMQSSGGMSIRTCASDWLRDVGSCFEVRRLRLSMGLDSYWWH